MISTRPLVFMLVLVAALCHAATDPSEKTEKPLSPREAAREMEKKVEAFGWTRAGTGKLGNMAQIEIPKGYRFTEKSGCQKMMELYKNIPNDSEIGAIGPEDLEWLVIFSFHDTGYVRDTDKDKLDADAILAQLKEGQEAGNEQRVKQGLGKLFIDGWAMPPRYNEATHNLEWAIKLHDEEGGSYINYLTKLLGRRGVMSVTLLVSPRLLQATLPDYQKLLTGFAFTAGQNYAEYRQGDKVAQYALTGLITAGAGFALAKSGWLGWIGLLFLKLGKAAYLLVIGVLAGLKRLLSSVFGRKTPANPAEKGLNEP